MSEQARPEGIPGVEFQGPYAVGAYAKFLQGRMRQVARVQIFGEIFNLRVGRGAKVYFELRDGDGAVPCSMWRNDFDKLGAAADAIVDGAQIVVAGGPDYYPGSRTSSPSFSFQVTGVRVAGEGDLLAQLDRLRKALDAEGLFEPQKALHRPVLPRTIGVVTGEGGKARDDVLAGLRRRGWGGRVVWAFAPVQDRHAAPRITQALQDLAAVEEIDVIVVARGGGSLADLFAFCDETLCRTVAMLRVPVIASVGHHTDRTLIDDVAAVSCSTPTHAAESAVPLHCTEARVQMARHARALSRHGRQAVLGRARALAQMSRAPAEHIARHRARLHQWLREIRAAGRRGGERRRTDIRTRAIVLERKAAAAAGPDAVTRRGSLDSFSAALSAHDPERVVARGYAVVDDRDGNLITTAADARQAGDVRLFFADADVDATISEEP
ncbi:MAG: exodeoxyribonuclease large subunit [Solirubrobacteraceae bacterium]|jgi:exodeoxyribonuclease VII large subunit|nr:exodeoxyribonuclease large subunit [Solirubrobacteraceae bacterium]